MIGGFETLKERGFISQCSHEQGLKDRLNESPVTYYVGFDPTGSSLHVGHLIPLFAMAHLQREGHRPIALVGGGTSRIGDPSGKTETRKILPIKTIQKNAENFKKQISRFIDFKNGDALLVDNTEWLAGLNHIDFLRDIGKYFSVNRMLSFEAYKTRLETGLSFIEFNYQVLQSYDYLILHRKYGCILQMGGDDQWGNIVSGMDLIRRIEGNEVCALTSPLITRSDGKKMGKTEQGALYLDPDIVSPYEFYQYWINVPDQDVRRLLLLLTFLPTDEAVRLGDLKDNEINQAKETLAYELTSIVHGQNEARNAMHASRGAFGGESEADLSAIPSMKISRRELRKGIGIIDLYIMTGLCRSKSEARRLILQGGAYVNMKNITDINTLVSEDAVDNGSIVVRAGKKRYFRFIVEDNT